MKLRGMLKNKRYPKLQSSNTIIRPKFGVSLQLQGLPKFFEIHVGHRFEDFSPTLQLYSVVMIK